MSCLIRKLSLGPKLLSFSSSKNSCRGSLRLRRGSKFFEQKDILCVRTFRTGSPNCFKIYLEIENEHAYSYMQRNQSYSPTLIKPLDFKTNVEGDNLIDILNQDWSDRTVNEVFNAFKRASFLRERLSLDLTNTMVVNLCSAVVAKCDQCEDSQIFDLLQYLALWPPLESIKCGQYYSLWRALDLVCLGRVKAWDINTNLLAVDHWCRLNLARSSKFVKASLARISRKLERLSPQQYVQLMYYINLCRKLPISASKFEFEYTLETLCNKLTMEELCIVSMGFFKSQAHIRSQQISDGILSRLESSFRSGEPLPPDSILLASLLKALRTSVHPTQDVKLYNVLDAILPHLKNLSLLCCLHVALVGSNIQLIHEGVMDSLCERFVAEMNNCRLKDIERLAFIFTTFNYDSNTKTCIYEAMVSEIRRRMAEREMDSTKWAELEKHGECLLRFLGFLTFRNVFPLDLIEKAMNPEFMKKVYGNSWGKIGREVLILESDLEILFPEQIKNRLSPEIRNVLRNKYQHSITRFSDGKKLSASDRLHVDVLENIRFLSGSEDGVSLHHILPQFERPDILFCIEHNQMFQNLSLLKNGCKELQRCPSGSGIWYAVVTGGRNCFIRFSNQPIGPLVHRISLLEKLGYKPILVPWFEWDATKRDEKVSYLKEKIFNCSNK